MRTLIVGALLVVAGCGPGQIDITPDRDVVAPGNCVGLVVANSGTFTAVDIDNCAPLLQRHESGAWVDAPTPSPEFCLLGTLMVGGFSRLGFYAVVHSETTAGEYRFVVPVGGDPVASTPFAVDGPSQQQMDERCKADERFQP